MNTTLKAQRTPNPAVWIVTDGARKNYSVTFPKGGTIASRMINRDGTLINEGVSVVNKDGRHLVSGGTAFNDAVFAVYMAIRAEATGNWGKK